MNKFNLCESEYRFASIIWENEPLDSGELVRLCREKLGWKKYTTYTVLKKTMPERNTKESRINCYFHCRKGTSAKIRK